MAGRNQPTEGDLTAIIIVWLSVGGNIVNIVIVIVLVGYGRLGLKKRNVYNESGRECEGE